MIADDVKGLNVEIDAFVSDSWPGLVLTLAPDRMSAFLNGNIPQDMDRSAAQSLLSQLIRKSGLAFGLQAADVRLGIDRLLAGELLENHVIARGKPAKPGQDARIERLLPMNGKPSESNAANSLDFRDRGELPLVNTGDKVARLIREAPAVLGKDVMGRPLVGEQPRRLKLQAGKGLELQEDDTLLVAVDAGMLAHPQEDKFSIINSLEIAGDVDFSVGHVNFPGLVKVEGHVLPGFRVNAYALEVDALERGSQVVVSSDLKVRQGIKDARITAGGNIYAYFIHQGQIDCEGDVLVSAEIVQSVVRAKGRVITTLQNGRIVNSKITGVGGVQTGNLISSGHDNSQVHIGMDRMFERQLSDLRQQVQQLTEERDGMLELLASQEPDLSTMENELKALIIQLGEAKAEQVRENLLSQISMIKPLRQEMRQWIKELRQKLENTEYQLNRLHFDLKDMLAKAPSGIVRLTVTGQADPGNIIFTPRGRLVLEQAESHFSAAEVEVKDKQTGQESVEIRLGKIRPLQT